CRSPSRRPPAPTLLPYTTLFRSRQPALGARRQGEVEWYGSIDLEHRLTEPPEGDVGTSGPVGVVVRRPQQRRIRLTEPRTGHHRSEEHTSELQSRENLVCRLLLE